MARIKRLQQITEYFFKRETVKNSIYGHHQGL